MSYSQVIFLMYAGEISKNIFELTIQLITLQQSDVG